MMYKTSEKAKELFRSIKKHDDSSISLLDRIEKIRNEWQASGKEFLSIEEIDSIIEEVRNTRYLEHIMNDVKSGNAHFAEHELIEVNE